MKEKILFILPSFAIGGTTVSTKNLVSLLDKDKYACMVLALDSHGLLRNMYDDVSQLETCFVAQALALQGWKDEDNWVRRIAAAGLRFLRNCSKKLQDRLIKIAINKIIGKRQFDTVVACQEGFATLFASYIGCPNKVAWVRCDYKRYVEQSGCRKDESYNLYNHIVCVAEKTTEGFVSLYPMLGDRIVCIHNPQNGDYLLQQSNVDDGDKRFVCDKFVIVSVGRLGSVKRFERIAEIAKQLMLKGLSFYWYIIGEGECREAIAESINVNNVGDCVIMLGAKSNPHYYIRRADLYVCLSSTEACPRVVNEAKILKTPVVSADFDTIFEYLEHDVNGIIAPIENMAEEIYRLMTDKTLYARIKENISGFTFDNSELMKKIESII